MVSSELSSRRPASGILSTAISTTAGAAETAETGSRFGRGLGRGAGESVCSCVLGARRCIV